LLGRQFLDLTNTSLANGEVTADAGTGTVTDAGPGSSTYRVDSSGMPIYADNPEAASLVLPTGYKVASVAEIEADNRPSGAYYDPELNAWLTPTTATDSIDIPDYIGGTDTVTDTTNIDQLFDTDTITGGADTTTDSTYLDDSASRLGDDTITGGTDDTDSTYVDDSAERLGDDTDTSKTAETIVAIDTDSQTALTDKGSVIDVADTAKVGDTVTGGADTTTDSIDIPDYIGGTGSDSITGGTDTVTDTTNIDQLFDTDTITGGTDTVTDTTYVDDTLDRLGDDKDTTYVDDTLDRVSDDGCGVGFHEDPVTGLCVPDYEEEEEEYQECPLGQVRNLITGECEAVEEEPEPEGCAEGFHEDPVTGLCVPDEEEEEEDTTCPPGYIYNVVTQECEPVEEEEEGCAEGFHEDPVTGLCVPDDDEEEEECPEGQVRNLNTGLCEIGGTRPITLPRVPKPTTPKPTTPKPTTPKPTTPPVTTEPSFNWSSLLGLLSSNQEQAPIKPELVGKAGWEEDEGPIDYTPFNYRDAIAQAKTDEEKARMVQEAGAAQGGSVDDLMAMLGIYEQDDSQSTGDPYLDELLATIR